MKHAGLLILAASIVPQLALAQGVHGVVRERSTKAVVSGIMIEALDAVGGVVARAYSTVGGEYSLKAPAGDYRLRVRRLGYRPETFGPLTLLRTSDVEYVLEVESRRLSLGVVRVEAEYVCGDGSPTSESSAAFALWEQVRTALGAVQLTARMRGLGATVVSYERSLDPKGARILEHKSRLVAGMSSTPWKTAPESLLRKNGYVIQDEGGWTTYFAPDLAVLTSDQFVIDYCMRLLADSVRRRIGITFKPTRGRERPDIAGTIWLSQDSFAPQRLEFSYTGLDRHQRTAGGEMEFVRASNGAWLIARWHIQMPVIDTRTETASGLRSRARFTETFVRALRVEGGELAVLTLGQDTLWKRQPFVLVATLVDSVTGRPVPAATVVLRGAAIEGSSNAQGTVRLEGVIAGQYLLDVRSPSLSTVGAVHTTQITLSDSVTVVTLRVPSGEAVATALCAVPGGILVGAVALPVDTAFVRGARVTIEWRDSSARDTSTSPSRWLEAVTDAAGRFRACGLPLNTPLEVLVESKLGTTEPKVVRLRREGLEAVRLVLQPVRATTGVITGVVISEPERTPVAAAEVTVQGTSLRVWTNAAGKFRLRDVDEGAQRLMIRRLGFQAAVVPVTVAPGEAFEGVFAMSRVRTLDTVSVAESAILPNFEENRRLGLGKFITREQLQRQEGRKLSEVLAQFHGISVIQGVGGRAWIASRRGTRSFNLKCGDLEGAFASDTLKRCNCFATVYFDKTPLNRGYDRDVIPDVNLLSISSIEAIEYYASPAETPLEYSRLNSQCGVLVLHRRRSR